MFHITLRTSGPAPANGLYILCVSAFVAKATYQCATSHFRRALLNMVVGLLNTLPPLRYALPYTFPPYRKHSEHLLVLAQEMATPLVNCTLLELFMTYATCHLVKHLILA